MPVLAETEKVSLAIAYHEVAPASSRYIYCVSCSEFEAQLRAAQERTADCEASVSSVQITFDDGHISQFMHALPLLEKWNAKAIFCVTAGWTGREPDYMSPRQLRTLADLGHTIYAHGWSHRMLTHCSPSELHCELSASKQGLEDILGCSVDGISMPHGRWNDRVLESCAATGFNQVYVSDPYRRTEYRSGVRLRGRMMMTRLSSAAGLADWIGRGGSPSLKESIRRFVTARARVVLGDRIYLRVWRRLGQKTEDLPESPPYRRREIRTLHLISSGGFYGAESMVLNLLRALPQRNVSAVLGAFENLQSPNLEVARRADQAGLKTEVIRCNGRMDWRAVEKVRALIYQHGIDIVHTHGFKATFYGRIAAAGVRADLIATYHNSAPGHGAWLRLYHLVECIALRGFSSIVAVSEPIRDSLIAAGLSPDKISVVNNGVDIQAFNDPRHQASSVTTGVDHYWCVGVVGRLIPLKGHRFLLEAAGIIRRRFPNTKFLFFGDGPERASLEAQVRRLELDDAVVFRGKQDDMPSIYQSLDVLVSPSLHEGMPMTLVEALASGCPIVATAVGGVPKMVLQNRTGLLVEPGSVSALGDAVISLLQDDALRTTLAREGQRWASAEFSSATMADCYCDIYARFAASTRSADA